MRRLIIGLQNSQGDSSFFGIYSFSVDQELTISTYDPASPDLVSIDWPSSAT